MFKKSIKYRDLNGEEIIEDFYFNLNKPELAQLEFSRKGGLGEYLRKMLAEENNAAIFEFFLTLIGKSYGRRGDDDKSFYKSEELSNWFFGTNAFEVLFDEITSDAKAAADFFNGIIPPGSEKVEVKTPETPPWIAENRKPTKKELLTMSHDQLLEVARRDLSDG